MWRILPKQRRRLVINIGGQKFGSQISNIGGRKHLGKIFFRQHSQRKNSSNFWWPFSLVIDYFFQNVLLSVKIYSLFFLTSLLLLCIFLSFSLFLPSFMFFLQNFNKNKNLLWLLGGGKKGVLPPILIIGARARTAPARVYTYVQK